MLTIINVNLIRQLSQWTHATFSKFFYVLLNYVLIGKF